MTTFWTTGHTEAEAKTISESVEREIRGNDVEFCGARYRLVIFQHPERKDDWAVEYNELQSIPCTFGADRHLLKDITPQEHKKAFKTYNEMVSDGWFGA